MAVHTGGHVLLDLMSHGVGGLGYDRRLRTSERGLAPAYLPRRGHPVHHGIWTSIRISAHSTSSQAASASSPSSTIVG
jgi:hypothetical protein